MRKILSILAIVLVIFVVACEGKPVLSPKDDVMWKEKAISAHLEAARNGDFEEWMRLENHYFKEMHYSDSASLRDENGQGPLKLVCQVPLENKNWSQRLKFAEHLLQREPWFINDTDKSFQTPLHVAAYLGDAELVELLIKKGANVNQNGYGRTPLEQAGRYGFVGNPTPEPERNYPKVVSLLLQNGADAKGTNVCYTPLHMACDPFYMYFPARYSSALVNPEIVRMLLAAGADVNAHGDPCPTTPFESLIKGSSEKRQSFEAVKLMIEYGADPCPWIQLAEERKLEQRIIDIMMENCSK